KGSNRLTKLLPSLSRKKNPYGKNFPKGQSVPESRLSEKDLNTDFFETSFGFSRVPSPFCSCTGFQRICYKWGAGGWQSSCCTINISKYPLPMSSTRCGSRIAGRKMSNGAYTKLLLKLASEGCDLSRPVDLKDHWARHGTNKFVTIK
ncbi:Protein BASIC PENTACYSTEINE7, partial [Linum perenne]